MIKRDTMEFHGKHYFYSAYKMFPSNIGSCSVNIHAFVYKNCSDTTWMIFQVPVESVAIRDTPSEVLFMQCDQYGEGQEDIAEILSLFDNAETLPEAKLDEKGVIESMRNATWRCAFKKNYREDGLELKNDKYPLFEFFIRYPYKLTGRNSPETIQDRAKMLPPWLFYDLSDYYKYFSNWGESKIKVPDFSNFPGAEMTDLKPIRWDDARATLWAIGPS